MTVISSSVCVFCGSRKGTNPAYLQAAREMGKVLAANHWRLVYGAGDVGLMGEVANATQKAGGETFGVIPQHLLDWEVGKRDLTQFIVTENMHERKKVMYMNSDAIVVLPGGAGSLDEYFEVVTWRQLGLHNKPILLLNTDGYWDKLTQLVDHVIDEGFAEASFRDFTRVCQTPTDAEAALRAALS
ncbi:MAG: TIGR00730 family Rossman fold protein [Pseudomonadota bacterium]